MKSKAIYNNLAGIVVEKIMEWYHYLYHIATGGSVAKSHLTEEYIIAEKYSNKQFVRDFLNERAHNIMLNRYKMEIRSTNEQLSSKEGTIAIGKVRLRRKHTLIEEATLVIKRGEKNNIIYWEFNK